MTATMSSVRVHTGTEGQQKENDTQDPTRPTAKHKPQPTGDRHRARAVGGGESALSPLSLCPCREDHPDQSPKGWAATQNEGKWVQADPQSHGTWMGENVQRSGWPMCSTLWNGDLLHWKGGNWSHVGPLAASMLMCLAREKPVTWRSESRPLSLWGSVWGGPTLRAPF